MIGACNPTQPLLDDAVDDFQKDILKPTDQVLFLTTPHDSSHHPINCEAPCTKGAANSLSLAMLDVLSKDIINPDAEVSVEPTSIESAHCMTQPSPNKHSRWQFWSV